MSYFRFRTTSVNAARKSMARHVYPRHCIVFVCGRTRKGSLALTSLDLTLLSILISLRGGGPKAKPDDRDFHFGS